MGGEMRHSVIRDAGNFEYRCRMMRRFPKMGRENWVPIRIGENGIGKLERRALLTTRNYRIRVWKMRYLRGRSEN